MYSFYLKYKLPGTTNLINPDTLEQGTLSPTRTGSTNHAMTDYIAVQPGQVYQGHSKYLADGEDYAFLYAYLYDLDKVRVDTWQANATQVGQEPDVLDVLTIPAGVYYVRLVVPSIYVGQDPNLVGLTPGAGSEFQPYYRVRKITPIYKKMDREFALEGEHRFYREKLNGSFKVTRKDYQWLAAAELDSKIGLVIVDEAGILSTYRGYFFKTDCTWDDDNQLAEIKKVEPDDDYEAVLAGLDKNFNLIKLKPELQSITLRRRPIIQVYIGGDRVITNFLGGSSWEQDINIDPTDHDTTLVDVYKFKKWADEMIIAADYASSLSTDITGTYVTAVREDGAYALNSKQGQIGGGYYGRYYEIMRVSDSAILYRTQSYFTVPPWNEIKFEGSLGDTGDTGSFYFTALEVYIRWFQSAKNDTNFEVPDVDIVPAHPQYKFIEPSNNSTIAWSSEKQVEPTEYGRAPEDSSNPGLYYTKMLTHPIGGLTNPQPVSPSSWRDLSIWFFYSSLIHAGQFYGGQDYELRDSYRIDSVINVLLEAVGSKIRHFASPEYSQLLYSPVNPLGAFTHLDFNYDGVTLLAETYSEQIQLSLAPKSNVIAGTYDQAASKADIKLGQVLNVLRDCFKIYWHIEDGKLRLEHVSFYNNGGSYDAPVLGVDLTNLTHLPTNKNWNFSQNKWEYDKEKMPERFEFGWMDEVSPPFEGFPIDIISGFVQKGRIENLQVSGASTDVDYIISHGDEVSKDGYCLLGAVEYQGRLHVPFTYNDLGYNEMMSLQNGLLAFTNLHPRYHVYDLPADRVRLNNEEITLHENNTKQKSQEVTYPGTVTSIDPYKLVKTGLGNGIIEKLSISMESRMLKATIKHDTK